MALETLSITVEGRPLVEWRAFRLSVSVNEAVRTAAVTLHVPPQGTSPKPGDKVTVKAGGDLLLTGYVRDFSPSFAEQEWSGSVTFVSRTIDATECSIVHGTGLAKGKDIGGIAKEFDSCGVGGEVVGSFEVHEKHQINPGETLYQTLEPLAFADGALIHDTAEGKLKITAKPDGDHAGGLEQGLNIVRAEATFSEEGRFNPVTIRGQQSRGSTKEALRPEAGAADGSVSRYRPKIMLLDTEATSGKMKRAAEWQARRGAGKGASARIDVKGWRDRDGKLWTPNFHVYVKAPRIYLDQMMAIESVVFDQDMEGEGTMARLVVVDPRALGGKSSGGKSGAGWAAPEPRADFRVVE